MKDRDNEVTLVADIGILCSQCSCVTDIMLFYFPAKDGSWGSLVRLSIPFFRISYHGYQCCFDKNSTPAVTTSSGLPYNSRMAKKGIKVKLLAKELGTTPRAIIDRCKEEGIVVQNSITVLSVDTEALVRTWLSGDGQSAEKLDVGE